MVDGYYNAVVKDFASSAFIIIPAEGQDIDRASQPYEPAYRQRHSEGRRKPAEILTPCLIHVPFSLQPLLIGA